MGTRCARQLRRKRIHATISCMYAIRDILRLANRYAAARHIATSTLAREATGSSTWFERCVTGRVTIRSATAVVQWLSDHWPKELEWPVDIVRPESGSRAGVTGERLACVTRGRWSASVDEAIGRRPIPEGVEGLVSPEPRLEQEGSVSDRPAATPARITIRNPFTPIGKVPGESRPVEYLVVATRNGEAVLTPVRTPRADAIRAKLAPLNLTAKDVRGVVARVREAGATPSTGGR